LRPIPLEEKGIITKNQGKNDKRKIIYSLTRKGLSVVPLFYEIALWGSQNGPSSKTSETLLKSAAYDKGLVLKLTYEALKSGSSFFNGPDSVVRQLDL